MRGSVPDPHVDGGLTAGADDYVLASELLELALGGAGQDLAARARALAAGARLDFNLQRLDRAEARASEALALLEQTGDPDGVADILETRAMIAVHAGRFPEALERLDRANRLFQDAGRLMRVGRSRSNLGVGLARTGRPKEGLAMIDEALELERALGHPEGEAYSLWSRSLALLMLGRAQQARESAEEALAVARRIGHREWSAAALCGLGQAFVAAGDLDAAEAAFDECLALAGQMPLFRSWGSAGMASVHLARRDFDAARRWVAEAPAVGTTMTQFDAHRVEVEIAVPSGTPEAPSIVRKALRRAEASSDAFTAEKLRNLAAEAFPEILGALSVPGEP